MTASTNSTAATAIAKTCKTKEYPITPEAEELMSTRLQALPKLRIVKDDLYALVATQEESFIQRRLLRAATDFLDIKLCHDKHTKGLAALNKKTAPPTSIRMKMTLTSAEKEVAASDAFEALVAEFEKGKAAFQALAKDLFIKTKNLELEETKLQLKNTYVNKIIPLVEDYAEMQVADMNETDHTTTINRLGGHSLIAAVAWRKLVERSTVPGELSVVKTETKEASFIIKMTDFLKLDSYSDFRSTVKSPYDGYITAALDTNFTSTKDKLELHKLIQKIITFIIEQSYQVTTSLYNTYTRHQQKKEVANRLRAKLNAEDTKEATMLTNDLLDKDDNVSAKTLTNFVQDAVDKYVAKNSFGQSKAGAHQTSKQKNPSGNKPSSTGHHNNNNQNTRQVTFQPANPNKKSYTLNPNISKRKNTNNLHNPNYKRHKYGKRRDNAQRGDRDDAHRKRRNGQNR